MSSSLVNQTIDANHIELCRAHIQEFYLNKLQGLNVDFSVSELFPNRVLKLHEGGIGIHYMNWFIATSESDSVRLLVMFLSQEKQRLILIDLTFHPTFKGKKPFSPDSSGKRLGWDVEVPSSSSSKGPRERERERLHQPS